MSYLVLARKWRPQIFEEVVGQGHVTQTLQNALKKDRLAHALIFSGARGVGKTSVARILAKALNCETGPGPTPCNSCSLCREITVGAAVDVQEIDGASNRGIDEIRQLREDIRFHPTLCRYRVFIIDEVHMLTKEAFNALLKTLEEPPPHVFFIFATTEPKKIPPTIHSRCQHYEFRRLTTRELANHLSRIVEAENLGLDGDAVMLLAREAEGSVRDSLSLLDQVSAFGATTSREVCEALGAADTRLLSGLAVDLLKGNVLSALGRVDEIYRFGGDVQKYTADLAEFFRHLVLLKHLGPEKAASLIDIDQDELKELSALLGDHSPHSLFRMLDVLSRELETIYRSASPKLSLEILILRLCHMNEVVGIDELIRRMDSLLEQPRTPCAASDKPTPADSRSRVTGTKSQTLKALEPGDAAPPDEGNHPHPSTRMARKAKERPVDTQAWKDFADSVSKRLPSFAPLLDCCRQVHADNKTGGVRLSCVSGMQLDLLKDEDNLKRLNDLSAEYFGRPLTILIEEIPDGEKEKNSGKKTCHSRKELIESPFVQEAINIFQARVSEVTVFHPKSRK